MHDNHRYPGFLANQPVEDVNGNPLAEHQCQRHRQGPAGEIELRLLAPDTAAAWLISTRPAPPTRRSTTRPGWKATFRATRPSAAGPYEAFWTPVQNLRIGSQYTTYGKFNGASRNYDGFGPQCRRQRFAVLLPLGSVLSRARRDCDRTSEIRACSSGGGMKTIRLVASWRVWRQIAPTCQRSRDTANPDVSAKHAGACRSVRIATARTGNSMSPNFPNLAASTRPTSPAS